MQTLAEWRCIAKSAVGAACIVVVAAFSADAATFSAAPKPLTEGREAPTATLMQNGSVLIAGGFGGSPVQYLDTLEIVAGLSGQVTSVAARMSARRYLHTATLLPNGKVLIAGGRTDATSATTTADLFDPADGSITPTGNLNTARFGHTATLLRDGRVLIAGGAATTGGIRSNTAEIYDPPAGTFSFLPSVMSSARINAAAALLRDGRVLIGGGDAASGAETTSVDIFDPAIGGGTFAASTPLGVARQNASMTVLPDGRVVIAAGFGGGAAKNSTEIFNPATSAMVSGPPLLTARYAHAATLLPDGTILFTGGLGASNSAELYTAVGPTTPAPAMTSARFLHTATLLPTGRVLVAAGNNGSIASGTMELYDPAAGTFSASGIAATARVRHTATLLPDGKVLIAGGYTGIGGPPVASAELYDPGTATFTATSSLAIARRFHTATLLPAGKVLIVGGGSLTETPASAELFDPGSGTFSATANLVTPRQGHTATLLRNGKVLIVGGADWLGIALASAELYDPVSGTFSTTGNPSARSLHTATLLPNGKVLIAGGMGLGGVRVASAQLYDPAAGAFSNTGPLAFAIEGLTATLLPNGKVLIAGQQGSQPMTPAELYDPATGAFGPAGTLAKRRTNHTATVLHDGRVLIAGGSNFGLGSILSAELYDPVSGAFMSSASLASARQNHTATSLPSGKILIVGGESSSSELFDPGLTFPEARRPLISSITNPVCLPAALAVTGSLFTGDSEASTGTTNGSAANAPILRLQRVDDDAVAFARPQSFTAGSYLSTMLNDLPTGHYRASIISNGIPSIEQLIAVATRPLLGSYETTAVNASASVVVNPFSLPVGFNPAFYPISVGKPPGFTGQVTINPTTGAVTVSNATPVGDYTIPVTSSTICGAAGTTFTLKVIGPATSLTATGGAPQSAVVNTAFASPLQVTVRDSAGHPLAGVEVVFAAPAAGASARFAPGSSVRTNPSGVASINAIANDVPGSYNVTAIVGGLTATFALTNVERSSRRRAVRALTDGSRLHKSDERTATPRPRPTHPSSRR